MNRRVAPTRPSRLRRIARWTMAATALAFGLDGLFHGAIATDDTPGGGPADKSAPATAAPPAIPAYRQANDVAVLTIEGEIDHLTLRSLERRIDRAVADGAGAIVLDIDTPGGRLDATLDICNMLKDSSSTPTNVVAWIHPQAYSAGTIIALACREIVVAPNATFGDAAPIHGLPVIGLVQMAPTERAKVEAPILTEIIDSARRNHYDENLVQAFVSVGVELWLIENVKTGERVVVDRGEYRLVFGEDPPDQIMSVTPPLPGPDAPRVAPRYQNFIMQPEPEESEAMSLEEIKAQIEYQQQLPPSRQPLTAEDAGDWRAVTQIISGDRLLTVKPGEALYYGLAVTTIANDAQLLAFFGAQRLQRYDQSWSEGLVRVLVSLPVRIVLIVIFLLGLFIELAAPGLGVFGAAAAGALLLLVGAPYLAGMAQWWDIMLIMVGVLLLGVELLVIPGIGIAGIAGVLCLLIGLVGTFVSGDIGTIEGREDLGAGIASILAAVFTAGVGIWFLSRHLESFAFVDRLVLKTELGGGLRAQENRPAFAPPVPSGLGGGSDVEIGLEGRAETDLRPSGRGEFEGRILDVQSGGRYIEKGTPIRIVTVGRYVIEVEEARS